tara:strand:- start:46 stop:336 length:291 start_codon:yes stop_codon:yes gene_type:complete
MDNWSDQKWLNYALSKMHTGCWYHFKKDFTGSHRQSYENIIIDNTEITKPSEAEVNAKIQELKDKHLASKNKKISGKQKLKDLGLDDDEIKALIGV